MDVHLRELRYFLAVAAEGSVTRVLPARGRWASAEKLLIRAYRHAG